ncbi:MAG: CvpA family protein [Bacteroidales bacterium]|nr:CvpA family protein [Bacteroidales bacterium]
MQIIDIVFIVLLLIVAIRGFYNGLIAELSALAALIIGGYVSFFFYDVTADFLTTLFQLQSKYLPLIAFVLTFILIVIVIRLIGSLIEKLVKILVLSFFNRLLGAIFGILKGALIISLILMLLNFFAITNHILSKEKQNTSLLYSPIEKFAPHLFKRFGIPDPLNSKEATQNNSKAETVSF